MKKYFDVVIPVHNSAHWLGWCLEELLKINSTKLRNIYVVNDRSERSQSQKIKEIVSRHKKVVLIENKESEGGFGYACNLGSVQCESEIILFLNTDCLVTEGVLDRLCKVFDFDQAVALACPVSNNSPDLTFPIFPGRSYLDMARLFTDATSHSDKDYVVEACTVVGNCLMVRRDFFEKVGGFSAEWGIGYGEETDLHMKALSLGLKGIVHVGCYVYHFGGGTFNYQAEIEEHKSQNHKLFMSKWSKEYKMLTQRCSNISPHKLICKAIDSSSASNSRVIDLDVVFYLPGIDQGIGGINAVVAICNNLVRQGVKATCALVGITADQGLKAYKEPVLFNFLYYISDAAFLADRIILPKVVFSTIFTSAPIVAEYCAKRNALAVQFVQGYEAYFENGQRYAEATDTYKHTEHLVTTSAWLFDMVNRQIKPDQKLRRLPLVISEDIYFSGDEYRDIDICMIFRSSPDKGQWLLAEILDRLADRNLVITVFCAQQYQNFKSKYATRVQFVDLPLDQYSLAQILRRSKVFVDTSLHEGFGLMPLEAALCGCSIVASDSGGVRDFISVFGGELIPSCADPHLHLEAIARCLKNYKPTQQRLPQKMRVELSWYEYVQELCKDRPPCEFLTKEEVHESFDRETLMVSISDNFQKKIYNMLAIMYKQFMPYMPRRLHLALKVLILGRI
jgi:GT2 family glycosyltransferase/glycosyltransferase involved in cell wall biosynthesis